MNGSKTDGWGGAILLKSGGVVTNCLIRNSTGSYGGAIGGNYEQPRSYVYDSEIDSCTAASQGGGCHLGGNIRMIRTFVHDCTAPAGGGLYCWPCVSGNTTTTGELIDSVVSNCVATGSTGGALEAEYMLTCSGNTFVSNRMEKAEGYGGAIFFTQAQTYRTNFVNDCTFIGNSAGSPTVGAYGGALSGYGNIMVSNSTFRGNYTGWHGGAIYYPKGTADNKSCFLRLIDCDFEGNRTNDDATDRHGAAFYVYERACIERCRFVNHDDFGRAVGWVTVGTADDPIVIRDCLFSNNVARTMGGALNLSDAVIVSNCVFASCSSSHGGAIYITSRDAVIRDCVFTNCSAQTGGAVYANVFEKNGSYLKPGLLIEGCSFLGNSARDNGGAVYSIECDAGKRNVLRNCLFRDNRVPSYGGALVLCGQICADGCVFEDNAADNGAKVGYGGALYATGTNWVLNCAFTNNFANQYGGAVTLSYASKIPMNSFLVVSNCDFQANGTYMDSTHNGWCGGAIGNVYDTYSGFLVTHSRFANAAAGDWTPAPTSPLRDRAVRQDWMTGRKSNDRAGARDLVGNPRWSGKGVDIGAFECFVPSGLVLQVR